VEYGPSVYFSKDELPKRGKSPCEKSLGKYVHQGAMPGARHYNAQRRARECFEYVRDVSEPKSGILYDYFVKTRPDLVFTQWMPFIETYAPGKMYWSLLSTNWDMVFVAARYPALICASAFNHCNLSQCIPISRPLNFSTLYSPGICPVIARIGLGHLSLECGVKKGCQNCREISQRIDFSYSVAPPSGR